MPVPEPMAGWKTLQPTGAVVRMAVAVGRRARAMGRSRPGTVADEQQLSGRLGIMISRFLLAALLLSTFRCSLVEVGEVK